MDEVFCKTLLTSIVKDYRILHFKEEGDENYSLSFQCKLCGESPDEKCSNFIKTFSEKTASNWVVEKCIRESERYDFRKRYLCQLSSKNKVHNKSKGEMRNYNCHASISIKFLKQTRHTLKKSAMLREGLCVLVDINYVHSHRIRVAQAYNLLRCNEDVKVLFESYFESGMSPAAAKVFHEMELAQTEDTSVVESLANAQKNPTEAQVNYIYKKWRKENYGDRDVSSATELLKKKQLLGGELCVKEDPPIVVIVTPIMKRAFLSGFANDIIFIDSSSSCDQSNTCVTFFFAPTKIGAVPVAVAFHTSQTEINYLMVFNAVKETLEKDAQKTFLPSVIMTDDSSAMRNALKVVFPNSTLLLCIFHVTQALWRWLWTKENNIDKGNRKLIMNMFRDIMFSESKEKANDLFSNMLTHDAVKSNAKVLKHLKVLWERREEWALAFRQSLLHRGHNTNNYCEASIRIFKDIVLQRCKAFNMCALADFVIKTFETYHKKRLLNFANGRCRKLTLGYEKLSASFENVGEIAQVDEHVFEIRSGTTSQLYTVDVNLGVCSCPSGSGGRFCKHLLAVEKKTDVLFRHSLFLSESDRREFAYLALGREVQPSFFKDINMADCNEEVSKNPSTSEGNEERIPHSPSRPSLFNMPIDEKGIEEYKNIIHKLNDQFTRIGQVLQGDINTSSIPQLQKFTTVLESLETPSQIMSFMCQKTMCRRSRKIRVQPTSISRRKDRGLSGGRIQAGRPSKLEGRGAKKRPHNIAFNINNNEPCAKKH